MALRQVHVPVRSGPPSRGGANDTSEKKTKVRVSPPSRRHMVTQACDRCRQRKAKCNGMRPKCNRCRSTHAECIYSTGNDRYTVLKRENDHLRERMKALSDQLQQDSRTVQITDSFNLAAVQAWNSVNFFSELPFFSAILCNGYLPLEQSRQLQNFSLPIYLAQPASTSHEQPISRAYSDFLGYARQEILKCDSPYDILDSPDVDVGTAVGKPKIANTSLLSEWACKIISSFGNLPLPIRLGAMHMSFRLMRWQIRPTAEHYAQIPVIMRPTPLQLFVPHPAFIDYLIWPSMRDHFILNPPPPALLDNWVALVASTVHLSDVPANESDIFSRSQLSNDEACFRLTPSFKEHIDSVAQWVVGNCVAEQIPGLEGKMPYGETMVGQTGEVEEVPEEVG